MGYKRKDRPDVQTVPATYPNRLRARIKAAKVLDRVQKCALGLEQMTDQELRAARMVLNKVLPDAVQPKDENPNAIKDIREIPAWKLLEYAEGRVISETSFTDLQTKRKVTAG